MRPRFPGRRSATLAAVLALAVAAPLTATSASTAAPAAGSAARTPAAGEETVRQYEIHGPATPAERSAIAATGVSIDEADDHSVVVSADDRQAKRLRSSATGWRPCPRRRTAAQARPCHRRTSRPPTPATTTTRR